MRPRRPVTALLAPVLAGTILAATGLAACSSSEPSDDLPLTGGRPTTTATEGTAGPGTAGPPTTGPAVGPGTTTPAGGDSTTDSPEVLDLQVPTEVPCRGDTARVPVSYQTANAEQVAFLVDQQPVQGGPNPPVSGTYEVTVTCDTNAHTILMAAVGPGGQAIASRAFRTAPTPG